MADTKISALSALTGANLATDDIFPVVDTSAATTKKITKSELSRGLAFRETLAAARTYYVRTDGSDSNDGLANTAGGAFLTIQKAIDITSKLDFAGIYRVAINIADGAYAEALILHKLVGDPGADVNYLNSVTITGNNITPANVSITPTFEFYAITSYYANGYTFVGIKFNQNGGGLFDLDHANIRFNNCEWHGDGVGNYGCLAQRWSRVWIGGPLKISGGFYEVFAVQHWSQLFVDNVITLSGTPTFSNAFVGVLSGRAEFYSTFSGSATGKRYSVSDNGAIISTDQSATYLPGNALGTVTTGGLYNNVAESHALLIPVGDETTALTTGTAKATYRMPYAMTLTDVRASVTTAPTGATLLTVDVNDGGTTILSTKLTFDAAEKTTTTAVTPRVISDTALADDAEVTVDIDAVGNTIAGAGLKVYLIGHRT